MEASFPSFLYREREGTWASCAPEWESNPFVSPKPLVTVALMIQKVFGECLLLAEPRPAWGRAHAC